MAVSTEVKRNFLVRTVENPEVVKWIAIGNGVFNFIAARQIEMSQNPKLNGADEPFIALTVFSVVVAGIMEAIKRAERFDPK